MHTVLSNESVKPVSFKRLLGRPTTWSDANRREHGRDYLLIGTVQGDDFGKANRKATTRPEDLSAGEKSGRRCRGHEVDLEFHRQYIGTRRCECEECTSAGTLD